MMMALFIQVLGSLGKGISKSTGVTVNNPVHAYFRWEGDKVSRVAYIFDSAEYVANME